MTQQQNPSIGRVVHYVAGDGQHLAATVSYVYTPYSGNVSHEPEQEARQKLLCDSQAVDLHVMYPDRERPVEYAEGIRYDPDGGLLSWHWPERV